MEYINNYDTGITYYSKTSLNNNNNYYDFWNGNF